MKFLIDLDGTLLNNDLPNLNAKILKSAFIVGSPLEY